MTLVRNLTSWIPGNGQGYVQTPGQNFLVTNLGGFLVTNTGNNIVTNGVIVIPKYQTTWALSGV